MTAGLAILTDRGVIEVAGPDARDFLQRLITNDVENLPAGEARYAALLTPQGKITADFFVVKDPSGQDNRFLLDVASQLIDDLVKRLKQYKLRAKVDISDLSETLAVVAWPAGAAPEGSVLNYADPRGAGLWQRGFVQKTALDPHVDDGSRWALRQQRIRAGVPEGGLDFTYGDTFPHEANLDRLQGVDFKKGCYVGQEVVSRVQHRGTARKRMVRLAFEGEPPPVGAEITLSGLSIGTMGSSVDGIGLGLVRLDRIEDGQNDGSAGLMAAGVALRIDTP